MRQWHSANINDYANSTIHSYLNSTFVAKLDANIQVAIKQVKIPYRAGAGTSKSVTSGANGLPAKVFLLSSTEVSFNHSYMPTREGAELSYFAGCADNSSDSKRIATLNGSTMHWWLRSPAIIDSTYASYVGYGDWQNSKCSNSGGVRPAFILPSDLLLAPAPNPDGSYSPL